MCEVWTKCKDGKRGTLLYLSTAEGCRRYVQQAIEKGASPNGFVVLNRGAEDEN